MLGADVDAAGGLIKEDDFAVGLEPFGEDDFLLVSAGEVAGGFVVVRDFDAEGFDEFGEGGALLAVPDEGEL